MAVRSTPSLTQIAIQGSAYRRTRTSYIVNRRAARFVANDYDQHSSVTAILKNLDWPSLEHRRRNQRLILMNKIVHNLVAVPSTPLIPADSRTGANHNYKCKNVSTSSSQHENSFFPRTTALWIKTLLRVYPWTSSRTVYRDLLSVYLPIGVICPLPSEFADYQAEAEAETVSIIHNDVGLSRTFVHRWR